MLRSPLPLVLAGVLAGALSACGPAEDGRGPGADEPAGPRALDPTVAALLADSADRAAAAIDDGDHCAALVELDALGTRAEESRTAGQLPSDVASELERVAAVVRGSLACETGDDREAEAAEPVVEPEPEDGAAPAEDDTPDGQGAPDDGAADGQQVEAELDVGTDAGDVDIEVELRPAEDRDHGDRGRSDRAEGAPGRSGDAPGRGRGRGDGP